MTDRVSKKQDRELSESAAVTSVDPEQLNELSVIDPPIWERLPIALTTI
jgi:hypothetical protein